MAELAAADDDRPAGKVVLVVNLWTLTCMNWLKRAALARTAWPPREGRLYQLVR